jgi:hypothetical protein
VVELIITNGAQLSPATTYKRRSTIHAATRPVPLLDLLVLGRKETTEGTALMAMIYVPPSLALI